MSIGLNYFITGQGYATIAMLSVCIGAITNIMFDFILIRTLKIGVAGAAIGTVVAQFISCMFVLCFLRFKSKIKLHKEELSIEKMKHIVKLGFSPFSDYRIRFNYFNSDEYDASKVWWRYGGYLYIGYYCSSKAISY